MVFNLLDSSMLRRNLGFLRNRDLGERSSCDAQLDRLELNGIG